MQVVLNKCFLLNPEKKIWYRSVLSFSRKTQKRTFNSEKWRHRAEGVTSFGIKVRLSRKRQNGFVPIFFYGLGEKNLFIITYIEKQCTRFLNAISSYRHAKYMKTNIV